MQQVSTIGVNVRWLFMADIRCGRERGSKQQLLERIACPVNISRFHSIRQNSRNWINSTARGTGDGDSWELSGRVVLESERDGGI